MSWLCLLLCCTNVYVHSDVHRSLSSFYPMIYGLTKGLVACMPDDLVFARNCRGSGLLQAKSCMRMGGPWSHLPTQYIYTTLSLHSILICQWGHMISLAAMEFILASRWDVVEKGSMWWQYRVARLEVTDEGWKSAWRFSNTHYDYYYTYKSISSSIWS